MRLEDYPRPRNDNGRGLHWSASVYHPAGSALDFWIDELLAMKIKWLKLLDDGGGSSLEFCKRLLAADIMPIIRLYRLEPNPGRIGGREHETIRRLVGEGVRYFETNNEPDLAMEWQGGRMPDNWVDVVVEDFIHDADDVLALGGLPALPALATGRKVNFIEGVVRRGRADLFERGAWIAIHNYTLNHPLDYPYDPVNQEGQPVSQEEYDRLGSWAWEGRPRDLINQWRQSDKNPGNTVRDDPSCFLVFQLFDEYAFSALGYHVPIISTEGGAVIGWKEDRRYPRVDARTHADWTAAITEYLQGQRTINGQYCPPSYFAMCHWLIANYRLGFMSPTWESQSWYTDWWSAELGIRGEVPAVAVLKGLPDKAPPVPLTAVIRGRVARADTDAPLPGLPVRLLSAAQEAGQATTDAEGLFRFEKLAAGAYDVAIAPWGVVRRAVMAEDGPVQPLQIRLTGGQNSVLTGILRTDAGEPVAGAAVSLRRDGAPASATTTGADGTFRFGDLPLGSYRLAVPGITVTGIALDGWQTKNLELKAGAAPGYRYAVARRRLLSAEETAGRRIFYGVVANAAGAPLNGIAVRMAWQGAAPGTVFPVVNTGSDPAKPAGRYEHLHSPGVFSLQVAQGDWPSDIADGLDTANAPGRAGQPVAYEVNFQLQPTGGPARVNGVVTGAPAGRQLTLTRTDSQTQTPQLAQLAADGSFAFSNLAEGVYNLALQEVGIIADDIQVAPSTLTTILFPLRSRLTGRVVDPPAGLDAVLFAPESWGWTRRAALDAGGNFVFKDLPPGRYRLEVGGQTLSDLALTGENTLQLAPIDLMAGQRSVVRGRVADAAGQPQADKTITLRRAGQMVAQQQTAADGRYRFANLSAGVYDLEVAGMGVVARGITLDGQREHVADVLWDDRGPRGLIHGRVLTAGGAPVPAATVRLLRGEAEAARVVTDDHGIFRFTGLPGGEYALAVGDGPPVVTGISLEEDATVVRDIVLPPAPARLFGHYLLFNPPPAAGQPGYAGARLMLSLAARYLALSGGSAGYDADDAAQATKVTIIGDEVPAAVEASLRAAGCQVERLTGDEFAVAAAIEALLAQLGGEVEP